MTQTSSIGTTDDRTWVHRIALGMLKGIGPLHARNLVAYCGGVDALFGDPAVRRSLEKVPGIGPKLAAAITDKRVLPAAEKELAYVRRNGLRALFYLDADYPRRLAQAGDAPVLIYVRGPADLDATRLVSIVGTRSPTEQGRRFCAELVEGLRESGACIVSGLAYGIDIVAHRTALKQGMPTVGCVAHGLDRLYPSEHAATAGDMAATGAVVSELPSGSPFAPGNFPARNRIIAGLSDCTVVVESGPKGGSLITADIADSYDREVMAVPGRPGDPRSEGCNRLIQQHKAALVTSAGDVLARMDWLPRTPRRTPAAQRALFTDLGHEEQAVVNVLRTNGRVGIDDLCLRSGLQPARAAGVLLELEFGGVVRCLPGKVYELA